MSLYLLDQMEEHMHLTHCAHYPRVMWYNTYVQTVCSLAGSSILQKKSYTWITVDYSKFLIPSHVCPSALWPCFMKIKTGEAGTVQIVDAPFSSEKSSMSTAMYWRPKSHVLNTCLADNWLSLTGTPASTYPSTHIFPRQDEISPPYKFTP